MPTRATVPVGAPVWNDLTTPDLGTTVAFYTALFGWTHHDGADGYGTFRHQDQPVAGVSPALDPASPAVWSVYLRADDVVAATAGARESGARVVLDPADDGPAGGHGRTAYLVDPSGAAVGLRETPGALGLTLAGEPCTPVWHELLTRDYPAAVAFYRSLGWTTRVEGDTADFRYVTFAQGDEMYGGIMDAAAFLPPDVPSHWSVYLGSADTDATVARAVELGAAVVQAAEDTPYGRLATLADPLGSAFKVIQGDT